MKRTTLTLTSALLVGLALQACTTSRFATTGSDVENNTSPVVSTKDGRSILFQAGLWSVDSSGNFIGRGTVLAREPLLGDKESAFSGSIPAGEIDRIEYSVPDPVGTVCIVAAVGATIGAFAALGGDWSTGAAKGAAGASKDFVKVFQNSW